MPSAATVGGNGADGGGDGGGELPPLVAAPLAAEDPRFSEDELEDESEDEDIRSLLESDDEEEGTETGVRGANYGAPADNASRNRDKPYARRRTSPAPPSTLQAAAAAPTATVPTEVTMVALLPTPAPLPPSGSAPDIYSPYSTVVQPHYSSSSEIAQSQKRYLLNCVVK